MTQTYSAYHQIPFRFSFRQAFIQKARVEAGVRWTFLGTSVLNHGCSWFDGDVATINGDFMRICHYKWWFYKILSVYINGDLMGSNHYFDGDFSRDFLIWWWFNRWLMMVDIFGYSRHGTQFAFEHGPVEIVDVFPWIASWFSRVMLAYQRVTVIHNINRKR